MMHGLYYRLHPCNDNCITEMESICNQKNIMYVTSEFMYIRDKVVKYFMKKIVVFIEKHYVSKKREEDQKPFVRYHYRCGICFDTKTTFNLCSVCKFSICIDCIKELQTLDCAYCRSQNIAENVSYRDTQRVYSEIFDNRITFFLCIDLFDMLYHVVSENDYIVLKEDYDCYCYHTEPKTPDYFLIRKNKRTGKITNRDILEQLLDQGYKHNIDTCSHYYFEGCQSTNMRTGNEYEIFWGS